MSEQFDVNNHRNLPEVKTEVEKHGVKIERQPDGSIFLKLPGFNDEAKDTEYEIVFPENETLLERHNLGRWVIQEIINPSGENQILIIIPTKSNAFGVRGEILIDNNDLLGKNSLTVRIVQNE